MDIQLKKFSSGFTLIEVMIVVAIIGILAAIAYPSYTEQVRKGRRAECRSAMLAAAQQMEKFYSNNNQYPTTLTAAGIKASSGDANACTVAITATTPPAAGGTPATYTLTATMTRADPYCSTLTLNELGTKDGTGSDKGRCWK